MAAREPVVLEDAVRETSHFLGIEYDITRAIDLTAGRVDGHLDVPAWAQASFRAENAEDLLDRRRPIHLLAEYVDTEYALGQKPGMAPVDLERPVLICAEYAPDGTGFGKLIDGRHRLYNAWYHGVASLPATILTDEERAQIRTNKLDPNDR